MPKEMVSRRICWPTPDAVCLQGGCGYCNDSRFRSLNTIRKYAESNGLLQDYIWGYQRWFCNAEVRHGGEVK
jgi:hypothetical protein